MHNPLGLAGKGGRKGSYAAPSCSFLPLFFSLALPIVSPTAGRRPNVHNLGLEEAGVRMTKKGAIDVDSYSRTNVSGWLGRGAGELRHLTRAPA